MNNTKESNTTASVQPENACDCPICGRELRTDEQTGDPFCVSCGLDFATQDSEVFPKNTTAESAAQPENRATYQVIVMCSDEFGGDEFGPYDSLSEAYAAIARIATKASRLNDNILRQFVVGRND